MNYDQSVPQSVTGGTQQSAALVPAQTESAVSWGAIVAGAAAAASLSLILLILGAGLGLSSVSPWTHEGISATAFGVSTILWVTFTQLIASGMGGYLAGRLRTRWLGAHVDEVHFRDTAHGFLAWAVASLATAALLSSVIGSIVGGGAQAGASLAGGAAAGGGAAASQMAPASDQDSTSYFVDGLFRPAANAGSAAPATTGSVPAETTAPSTAEAVGIFANALRTGTLQDDDLKYLAQVVSQRTGLTPQDAETRVSETFKRLHTSLTDAKNSARDAADKALKASAYGSLWLFISLLIGAFVASLAATFGGRQRDL